MIPQDFTEVEALILQLYSGAQPSHIDAIQKQLQEVQRTSGWALADALLSSEHLNVRFFAALTFQVKLNQEGANLSNDQRLDILSKLLEWTIRLTAASEKTVVLQKLCSALINFFFLPKSPWTKCLRHLICCLSSGQYMLEELLNDYPKTEELLKSFGTSQINTALALVSTLGDDSMRIDGTNQHIVECRSRINQNLDDVFIFLQHFFSSNKTSGIQLSKIEILPCYLSWIAYCREVFSPPDGRLDTMRGFLSHAGACLLDEDTYLDAAEFFIDLFTTYEEFLETKDFSTFAKILENLPASSHLTCLQDGSEEPDALKFGQMALAYGQAAAKLLNDYPDDTRHIMALIHDITKTQNHKTIIQSLFNAVMDFWEAFTSRTPKPEPDAPPDKQKNFEAARDNWLQAIEELCYGTALPIESQGHLKRISADEPLSEFRARVVDAVQTSYADFDVAVLQKLVYLVLEQYSRAVSATGEGDTSKSFDTFALARVESTLNCLKGLTESLYYDSDNLEREDGELFRLFGSKMYAELTNARLPIPMALRKNAVNVIAGCDSFLSRYDQYLLSALEILLRSLENQALVTVSARAIFTLCDTSRKKLNSMTQHFLTVCEQFLVFPLADLESKEYVVGATAAIIQALPNVQQQVASIERLLTLVASFHSQPITNQAALDEKEELESRTINTLSLLASIGTSLQIPDDAPIDLDDDESPSSGVFSYVQAQIVQFLRSLLQPFHENGRVFDAICRVLRTGFRERRPGPFVFEPEAVIELLVSIPLSNSRVDGVFTTAGYLVSSKASTPARLEQALGPLLQYLCATLKQVEISSSSSGDPEILSAAMELMERLSPTFLPHVFTLLPGEYISIPFQTSISCLAGADILPKRSAAMLWTCLLKSTNLAPETMSQLHELVVAFGQPLMTILVANFGGRAARSELECLSEPFRRLIMRFPRESKQWVEVALFSPSSNNPATAPPAAAASSNASAAAAAAPSGTIPVADAVKFPDEARVNEADKRRFVSQVLQLRGDKRTSKIVKEFWAACRGTPLGYG